MPAFSSDQSDSFSREAERAIMYAGNEARAWGSSVIQTVHLLLGVLKESPELDRKYFPPEASLQTVKAKINSIVPKGNPLSANTNLTFSKNCKLALSNAITIAEDLKCPPARPRDILFAIIQVEQSVAASILNSLGINNDSIGKIMSAELTQNNTQQPSNKTTGAAGIVTDPSGSEALYNAVTASKGAPVSDVHLQKGLLSIDNIRGMLIEAGTDMFTLQMLLEGHRPTPRKQQNPTEKLTRG